MLRALNGLFLQISARNKALLSLNKPLETQVTIRTRELTITNRHLEELAKTLLHGFRSDDVVCRLGGDEFLVICPDTDSAGGFHIANQVLQTVAQLQVPTGDQHWLGSVSIGVAHRTPDMAHYEDLIKMADRGVYVAKEAGRGCVRSITGSA